MYYVYIIASRYRRLYTGVTNDVKRRTWQHKNKVYRNSFTKRYNIDRLVYFEEHLSINAAMKREKRIKKWRREKRLDLVESRNPDWVDLSTGWYG
jgi:putative endonuclease